MIFNVNDEMGKMAGKELQFLISMIFNKQQHQLQI